MAASKQTAAPARADDAPQPAVAVAEPAPVAKPVADAPVVERETITLDRKALAAMTADVAPTVVGPQYDPKAKGAAVPPPPPAVAPLPPRAGDPDA